MEEMYHKWTTLSTGVSSGLGYSDLKLGTGSRVDKQLVGRLAKASKNSEIVVQNDRRGQALVAWSWKMNRKRILEPSEYNGHGACRGGLVTASCHHV
jgi:hypothetical protein